MAAASSAGGGMRLAFDSCLSEFDCGIDRRPYHRNCGCALHKSKSKGCLRKASESSSSSNNGRVAFPIRRSWSEGCLALANTAAYSVSSGNSSPASGASSVVEVMGRRKASLNRLVELCGEEDEDEDGVGIRR